MKKTNKIKLGMPNLNYNGLDETWLLKFCGNIHWELLHKDVNVYENNDRFYASFFHIQVEFDKNQAEFKENDEIKFKSELFKYNDKIYRSVHKFNNSKVIMDTIFVKKGKEGGLTKFKPAPTITKCKEILDIGIDEHQDKKRKIFSEVYHSEGNQLVFPPVNLFNGVKILYCANYLFLVSLSEFTQHKKMFGPIKSINIRYYGNMTSTDTLYGKTSISHAESESTETVLFVNNAPISYCEIIR